jgi:hypothetical protein
MKTKLLYTLTALAAVPAFAQDIRKPVPTVEMQQSQSQSQSSGSGAVRAPGPIPVPAPMQPLMPLKPTPFLGVSTSPVPPVLGAQLGLPEGFGLVVDEVLPESPAGKAGVQRFDVLRLFNDQQLVDPGQLAALVRAVGKDAEVSLTLLRKGQEQKVSMKVGERPMPVRVPFPGVGVGVGAPPLEGPEDGPRKPGDRVFIRQTVPGPNVQFQSSADPADVLREVRPGGAAQVRVFEPNGVVTYNTAQAKMLMKDDNGVIEITTDAGRRQLLARDAKGNVIFDGPIDTPEQRKTLPENVRRKVEAVESRTTQEFNLPLRTIPNWDERGYRQMQ